MSKLKTADEYIRYYINKGDAWNIGNDECFSKSITKEIIKQVQIDTKSKCIEEVERKLLESNFELIDVEKLKEMIIKILKSKY